MNTFTGSRTAQKAATRQAIVEAARAEFEAVGFDAATVRGIARRAGVAVGTVMAAGDKRELLHTALFDSLQAVLGAATAALNDAPANTGGDVARGLDAFAAAVLGHYQARPALSRALLKESLFADGDWATRFAAQTSSSHSAVAAYLARASGPGAIVDVDASMAAGAWLSFFYFALIGWVQGQLRDPRAFVAALTAQHLRLPTSSAMPQEPNTRTTEEPR